jgi:hypothetical protein
MRALVRFDPTETAMKLSSITDAQNLIELIFCVGGWAIVRNGAHYFISYARINVSKAGSEQRPIMPLG